MRKRTLWHLGNTTVRSPFRLKDGLAALSNSDLLGNLHGREKEVAFRKLLGTSGIVELGEDESYSVGRKWRSALCKMGFLISELPDELSTQQNIVGQVDTISESGYRLIKADSVPAIQECFLRSLAAYTIPNPLEENFEIAVFSPLKFVLKIMVSLKSKTGESSISFTEMGVFVISQNSYSAIEGIVSEIITYRMNKNLSSNKKRFDNEVKKIKSQELGYVQSTIDDYADLTIRYLKATGLFSAKGRGISLYEEKMVLIEELVTAPDKSLTAIEYFKKLYSGADLPTDELIGARKVLEDVQKRAELAGISISPTLLTSVPDINAVRHSIEEKLFKKEEENYANEQSSLSSEIIQYLDILIANKRTKKDEEGVLDIPSSERPAYLEWILWRAFLAISHLVNKPYECRRFNIDQSFLPVGTAPGNGPDLIFEYEQYTLVVEVTLTDNSRQEAAEGETVRRHVTDIMRERPDKPTYGLFIANNINTNTAHTFKLGIWYSRADEQINFVIVPIELRQFRELFITIMKTPDNRDGIIKKFLDDCLEKRDIVDAPEWKVYIKTVVDAFNQTIKT